MRRLGPTQEKILKLLEEHLCLSTHRIAKMLGKNPGEIHNALVRLFFKNLVNSYVVKEEIPGGGFIVSRYWYLTGRGDAVREWLKKNRTIQRRILTKEELNRAG
jgi:predicted transcriptional regulator